MIRPSEVGRGGWARSGVGAALVLTGALALLPAAGRSADAPTVREIVQENYYFPLRSWFQPLPVLHLSIRIPAGCPPPERRWVDVLSVALGEGLQEIAARFVEPVPARGWAPRGRTSPCSEHALGWFGGPREDWAAAGGSDPPWACTTQSIWRRPEGPNGDLHAMLGVSPYAADGAGGSVSWVHLPVDERDYQDHSWRYLPDSVPVGACGTETRPEARERWEAAAADVLQGWRRVLTAMAEERERSRAAPVPSASGVVPCSGPTRDVVLFPRATVPSDGDALWGSAMPPTQGALVVAALLPPGRHPVEGSGVLVECVTTARGLFVRYDASALSVDSEVGEGACRIGATRVCFETRVGEPTGFVPSPIDDVAL